MKKASDPSRSHRVVGYVFAVGFLLFIGVPVLVVSVIGECLPRGTAETFVCDSHKRIEFLVLLFATPVVTGFVGWLGFQMSKFFDGPNLR